MHRRLGAEYRTERCRDRGASNHFREAVPALKLDEADETRATY
jgi:hypothetical protein